MLLSLLSSKWARYLIILVLGICFSYLINHGLIFVELFGRYVPSEAMATDYIKAVIWAAILFLVMIAFPLNPKLLKPLLILWAIRTTVTLGAMLFYEYKYTLDAYGYFRNGLILGEDVQLGALEGTQLISGIVGYLINLLPGMDSYHSLKVLFSFSGLMGSLLFYLGYVRFTDKSDERLLWILGLVPSILFWSSILGKDPLVFLGLGLFFYSASGLVKKLSVVDGCLMLASLALVFVIRFWVPVLFVVPFLITVVVSSQTAISTRLLLGGLGVSSIGLGMTYLMNKIDVHSMADVVARVSHVSSAWSHGGSANTAPVLSSLSDMIKFLPLGMFTTLFRPLPGEVMNIFGLMSGLENLFLIIFFARSMKMLNKDILNNFIVVYTLILLVFWSSFYSFISYQNLGTAVRFKLQVLPFMVMWIFFIQVHCKKEGDTNTHTPVQ